MFRRKNLVGVLVVCFMIHFASFNCFAQKTDIQIIKPLDEAKVGLEYLVRGKVLYHTQGNVYVLLHPLRTNLWWVQRPPKAINKDGSWQTLCYFGTKNKGVGEYFELVAIITKKNLKEGQTIEDLPKGAIKSSIITVQRTK